MVSLVDLPATVGAYTVDAMRLEDVAQVSGIERLSFPEPWPADAYRQEVAENPRAHYVVVWRPAATGAAPQASGWRAWLRSLRGRDPAPAARGPLLGFAGLWLLVDEGHVSTIAVAPEARGRGLGELLLVSLIERALALQAAIVTLEVRVSNAVAQNLYRKYEFEEVGRRKRYYRDNGEDAYIMTVPALDAAYRARFEVRKQALLTRLTMDPAMGIGQQATVSKAP